MAKKKKRRKHKPAKHPQHPLTLRWEFGPEIPTDDVLAGLDPTDPSGCSEVLDNFISAMVNDDFLAWEAVMSHEQGLPLTRDQRAALEGLINFGDSRNDQVLYIDEIARPGEPWYATLNKLAPYLLLEPFRTSDVHDDVVCDGWQRLVRCLDENAGSLSLPPGVSSPIEVVPPELRHKLFLQDCFDALAGLGQYDKLTLEDEEEREDRIPWFVDCLRDHKESVRYFDLTLDSLLDRVIVPEKDRPILIREMQTTLGMAMTTDRLADYL